MTDSHCHIAGEAFIADLPEVVARARAAGVTRALVILAAEDDPEIARAGAVVAAWPECRFAVGVHPHHARVFEADPQRAADLVGHRLDTLPEARAIGEIGLDYHYDFSPRETQQEIFARQVALAIELELPVVIHTREATEDTFRILREAGRARGVFHCFTGDVAMARGCLDLGFHLSFAGILTFPRAAELREAAAWAPAASILAEPDSPYLAPVPVRGKRNAPAHVARVYEALAAVRRTPQAVLTETIAANVSTLFGAGK